MRTVHRALELEEELLRRIDVIVGAGIRPADHRDHEIVLAEDGLRAERRLQLVGIFRDPLHQVERGAGRCSRLGLLTVCCLAMTISSMRPWSD